jgi:hypothetical protein
MVPMSSDPHLVAQLSQLPNVPDFLGKAERVDSVASLIQSGQKQLGYLKNLMVLNGESVEDRVPADDNSRDLTYQQRFDALEKGIQDLMEQNSDIREDLIGEAVIRRKEIERKIEESHKR